VYNIIMTTDLLDLYIIKEFQKEIDNRLV